MINTMSLPPQIDFPGLLPCLRMSSNFYIKPCSLFPCDTLQCLVSALFTKKTKEVFAD